MSRRRKIIEEKLDWSDRLADKIADFTGNIVFVWIHATVFFLWIIVNTMLGKKAWDPYPFIFLTLIVSLEAIFLATFVLMAQNRESRENEIRDQLDYDVDVRASNNVEYIKRMLQEIREELKQKK